MLCALVVVSGLVLFLAGIITGAVLVVSLERPAPVTEEEPPVLVNP